MSFYLLDHSSVNGTQWQQWGYPRRGASLSGTVIMHTSESVLDVIGDDSTAEDCAAFIARRTGSYGSYHDLVDSDSIIEMAPFEYETWQDSETNPWAVGISAACRTTDWATMGETKAEGFYRNLAWCAADFVKYMRTKGVEVPRRRITGAEARARVPGFCAHGDSGLHRSDPGKDFDWNRFFRYTEQELNGEEMSLTPEQAKQLAYIASPDFKKHIFTGETEVERIARSQFIDDILNHPFPWNGFDGQVPTEGRRTTNLTQIGWLDTQFAAAYNLIRGVVANPVELTEEDIEKLAESLKASLSAELAADLAKRLAE